MPFATIAIFCFLFHEKGEKGSKSWQKEIPLFLMWSHASVLM